MSHGTAVRRGAEEIERLLRDRPLDLRTVDLRGFRDWLARELPGWRRDPVFRTRETARDLRRAHPRIAELEAELRRALALYRASAEYPELQTLERETEGVARAIEGLTRARDEALGPKREALSSKLRAFQLRGRELRGRHERLAERSAERARAARLENELGKARMDSGLEAEETRLADLLAARGRGAVKAGGGFEEEARDAMLRVAAADFGGAEDLLSLRGVTLGAAALELDQLVVRRPPRPGEPADVLALVEAKRNVNDLGGGFRQRQRNLAWLTGDHAAYDPGEHRTRSFPTGHFDRVVSHRQEGEEVALGPGSFARFRRDPGTGFYLDRLYFVTRPRPLLGASMAAISRIRHRVATDVRFTLEDERYVGELLSWTRTLLHSIEAPDVLRACSASPERARQIVFLERLPNGSGTPAVE